MLKNREEERGVGVATRNKGEGHKEGGDQSGEGGG